MLFRLMCVLTRLALRLRYRITVKGLEDIRPSGKQGILFLPNHPALIDPVIVMSVIGLRFKPRPLADEKQVRGTFLRYFRRMLNVLAIPDLRVTGAAGATRVQEQLANCVKALQDGDNVLLYPAGHLYRSRYEKLHANGGVERILHALPDVRVVLVRTTGLWGSSFGRCKGYQPHFNEMLLSHLRHLAGNLLFFTPRRKVTVELFEAGEDFPRHESREVINRHLEAFYNATSTPNTYVPYYWWERGGARTVPEPSAVKVMVDTHEVPADVRAKVLAKLEEMSGKGNLTDDKLLGSDLNLDSLMVSELLVWVQEEFGVAVGAPETVRTVGCVLLAAIGRTSASQPLKPVPDSFLQTFPETPIVVPPGDRITDIFLDFAQARPDFPLLADQMKGVVTHRKMILAIMVLSKTFRSLPDERIGFIMPACLTANIVYMAMLFANKVPVMLNWTVGLRNLRHCMESTGVRSVLTSRAVIDALESKGTDFGELKDTFRYLEDIAAGVPLWTKLGCLVASKVSWGSLRRAKVQELCAILFTSGSESLPKAVPITHRNILTDLRTAVRDFQMNGRDVVIGMLPPFHSFGLLINFLLPNCSQVRVVYHTNPLEGELIARLVEAYRATMLVGTPTFVHNILRNATPKQVATIRIAITGAEKCPQSTYDLIHEKCPTARLNEGYGITECAPIVSLNVPGATRVGSLGRVLDCMEWTIRDEELRPVPAGETGMLYVRGANVFSGYLNYDGPSPFVELDGQLYYRTGDLVAADADGFIFFKGRKKRFVKIGGEMVSLPAIEEVLMQAFRKPDGDLPLAVEALGTEEQPAITLFTIYPDLTREAANAALREARLSPIHNIRDVVRLEAIPVLGTGKTDYRTLKAHGQA